MDSPDLVARECPAFVSFSGWTRTGRRWLEANVPAGPEWTHDMVFAAHDRASDIIRERMRDMHAREALTS